MRSLFLNNYELNTGEILLFPLFSSYAYRHFKAVDSCEDNKSKWCHRIIYVIEWTPLIGTLASIFEYACFRLSKSTLSLANIKAVWDKNLSAVKAFFFNHRAKHSETKDTDPENNDCKGSIDPRKSGSTHTGTHTSSSSSSSSSTTILPPDSDVEDEEEDEKDPSSSSSASSERETLDSTSTEKKEAAIPPSALKILEPISAPSIDEKKKLEIPVDPLNELFKKIEEFCAKTQERVLIDPTFSAETLFSELDKESVKRVQATLDNLIKQYENSLYGSIKQAFKNIKMGDPIPGYFAMSDDDGITIREKKYLSLLGIRNLLVMGPKIIDQLQKTKFLGGIQNYADHQGLSLFHEYTGNMVDLDIEIEVKNDKEAIEKAKILIDKFCKKANISSDKERHDRKLHLKSEESVHISGTYVDPTGKIPKGRTDLDRSNYGVWKRGSSSTYKYFVNIPELNTVIPAILRLPFLIAQIIQCEEKQNGKLTKEFYNDFFENCISEMCFNDKLRSLINKFYSYDDRAVKLTPEEEVKQRIEKGDFGDHLKKIGSEIALSEATYKNNIFDDYFGEKIFDKSGELRKDFAIDKVIADGKLLTDGFDKRVENEWVNKAFPKFKELCKDKLNNQIYRDSDKKDEPYFWFNENALRTLLHQYYQTAVALYY